MKKVLKETISTLLYLLIVLILTMIVIKYVGQRTVVDGSSMEPTLSHQDNLIVDKISYRFGEPERFDIIVFPFQYGENVYYIKRIIGLPGETVQIDTSGNIYINGELLKENYGKETIAAECVGIAVNPIVLGEDEYFVLGDNRNYSEDSRFATVGNIKKENVIGKDWFEITGITDFGFIK